MPDAISEQNPPGTPDAAPQASPDVVVVGAGPTGLMAAALLVRSGLTVRILDKSPRQAQESRAFAVQARSMELFLSIGLADALLDRGLMASGVQIHVGGELAAEVNFDDIGRTDTPYPFLLMVPQSDIEAILAEDLRRLGVEVERTVEAIGFEQTAEGVRVQTRSGSGETREIAAAWLIGADGAHSMVRKQLGLTFEGAPYPQTFLLADCKIDWPLDYDHLKVFLNGRHLAAYLPLKGQDVGRVIAIEADAPPPASAANAEAAGSEPATLDEAQKAFRAAVGIEATLRDPVWLTRYRIHHRAVNSYGKGRVFVAGDAAHIHSPAGGQGMNTGLQDAANLIWKLALVLKGDAPAKLLETYDAERWPVGQWILHYTDRIFSLMSAQNRSIAGVRNRLLPLVARTLTRNRRVRARGFRYVSQLGIRYENNDFLLTEGKSGPLAAGRRAPNAAIGRNRDVFSLIGGYRLHVLALSRKPLSAEEIEQLHEALSGVGVEAHIVAHSLVGRDERLIQAESSQIFDVYGDRGLFLTRPDGYLAYCSDHLDATNLKKFLREKFGVGGPAA